MTEGPKAFTSQHFTCWSLVARLAVWSWRFTLTGNRKSQVEFYLRLHVQLVRCDPLEQSSSVKRSQTRDINTLQCRVANEGLAFLTKSLPRLGKAFDQGLVSGKFNLPNGFKSGRRTSTPAFMQAHFNLVFDEDGLLRDEVPIDVIRHVRQVLFFAYKLVTPYSATENARVIERFVQVDAELELRDSPPALDIQSLAEIITGKVFHGFDHSDIHPQHGPGAVATGERLEAKWKFHRYYSSIASVYPYHRYFEVGGLGGWLDQLVWGQPLEQRESGAAKVVLVPKDSRGPRLISCEPLEYQWIQQGLGRKLSDFMESLSRLTRGQINFERQEINSGLAKVSSADQCNSTLDLEDASDRVSLEYVRRLFSRCPDLLRALEACRTTETKLPDGRMVPLKKFAPMGSALCFPVMAYTLWVTIVSAICISRPDLSLDVVGKLVYVYGDDIIVPTEHTALSIQALELVGLRVNRQKSCTTGFFRESCGVEAYQGHDVTPIRLRKPWTNRIQDGSALAAYTKMANAFALVPLYVPLSDLLWAELDDTYGTIPWGTIRASYPCKVIDSPSRAEALNRLKFRWRSNRNYQRIEFFLPSLSPRRIKSELDGWPRLRRNLVAPPFGDPSNVVLPRSTKIKRGWTAVF